ncbi:MAG TPA: Asp-tRNA(Asn)/Glu-tRNA(Gln) amidotransferase subunit GatB [Polyangiaceae bacterium]|nr:Asp-tRNA(Asn)/Glu-tRNA(Gln) amidotransferase subunit GatB [Polyangiaceae bacterium]
MPAYEAVVGLEVHAQLLTASKAFCACPTSFGAPPNAHVCPVCLGLPGALPVLNRRAVRLGVRAALGLGMTVHETSVFARKNYFYPDLPKGYQISQYDRPLATGGRLRIEPEGGEPREVRLERLHLEEDAGKTLHGRGDESVVDLNRAGTPLAEIVGAPELGSGAEAAAYLKALRDLLMFLGVNDGNLEEGSFRCDANVSVRPVGETKLGTRCEIKNVNSFRFVQKAIDYEAQRQVALLESGGRVVQETRGWSEREGRTYTLRSKEDAHDYRYFPEPDLPPLALGPELVREEREAAARTPEAARARLERLGLSPYAARVLTGHPGFLGFFDGALALYGGEAKKLANFVMGEVLAGARTEGLEATFAARPGQVAELLRLVDAGTISGKQAKDVYAAVAGGDASPEAYVREHGLAVTSDEAALEAACRRVLEANPKQVAGYRAGKANLLGYFVGAVMKETSGRANPALVNALLKRLLEGGG